MSMNFAQRAMMARNAQGMGLWSPEHEGMSPGSDIFSGGGGGGDFGGGGWGHWGDLIKGSAFTLSNIFGKPGNTQAAYQPTNTNTNTLSVADQLALIEARKRAEKEEELASGSISSKGIKFGDTVVSWPAIALGVGAFFLVQSQGFQRRGR